MKISFSKRILVESLILMIIVAGGVSYTLWGLGERQSAGFPCARCPLASYDIYSPLYSPEEYPSPIVKVENEEGTDGKYQIGNIIVDKNKGVIRFPGVINKTSSSFLFLLAPEYQWLGGKSAISAEIKLIDLQNAIALLDWEYWELIRAEEEVPFTLLIQWSIGDRIKQLNAVEVIQNGSVVKLSDLIFLGTEVQWQELALQQPGLPTSCPLLYQQKELQPRLNKFGSQISPLALPPPETEVTIILKVLLKAKP